MFSLFMMFYCLYARKPVDHRMSRSRDLSKHLIRDPTYPNTYLVLLSFGCRQIMSPVIKLTKSLNIDHIPFLDSGILSEHPCD